MTLTVGSLFTGIGGIDLGLERAGMRVAWQAEIDPYCSRVLERHWPNVPNLGDVTTIDWTEVPSVDLLCGGYPCQPFSVAGRRQGDQDPRHLWPHMRDAVRLLRPRFVLLENVAGHLALGFGRVLGDLAEIGYDAEWDCIPVAAVGAPHRRDRVFIVAYPARDMRPGTKTSRSERQRARPSGSQSGAHVADANSPGLEGHGRPDLRAGELAATESRATGRTGTDLADADDERPQGRRLPERQGRQPVPDPHRSSPRIFGRPPRPSLEWAVEPDVGRVAHGIPNRVDRLRALGNAVVPQVAQHIGQLIVEAAA